MHLLNAFVRNPVKIAVGVLLTALFGVVALFGMPMQLTPEVDTPTISIETRWRGASPHEIEREIIIEQEEQLKSVEGVVKMSSESSDSTGKITLEFAVGTDIDLALPTVQSRLEQVREYPVDADKPVLSTSNSSDRPIAWFILSPQRPSEEKLQAFAARYPQHTDAVDRVRRAHNVGIAILRVRELAAEHPEANQLLPAEGLDVSKMRRFAEDEIEALFERVKGVSQSNVIGGLEEEMQVVFDPEKMAARELTLWQVRDVLRGQNKDTSGGDFWEGKRRLVLRTLGRFKSPKQVENQLLAVRDGKPVYVKDVAEVRLGYKKPDGMVRRFGESNIAVNCLRKEGANVLDVMEGLRRETDRLNAELLGPRGLQLTQVYDETDYILSAVGLVEQNIFIGGALTAIVLMLFLHLNARTLLAIPLIIASALAAAYLSPWLFIVCLMILIGAGFWFARGALVVALAIPTSIVGTFLVLGALGRSLNVISLAGLAFAVGMLVDNAVVVLENIYRRYAMGEKPFIAAVRATQEVWGAVVASTLTTVAVFLPIVFVEEQAGQLFRDIALAISASVVLSLIVAMTVIPTATARLLKRRPETDEWEPWASDANESKNDLHQRSLGFAQSLVRPIEAIGERFVEYVVAVNDWIQHSNLRKIAVATSLVIGAIVISWRAWPKVEYLPTGNRNLTIGFLLPPPGYNIDQLTKLGQTVEDGLRPYWDVDPDDPETAKLKYPILDDFFFVARGRSVFLGIRSHDPARAGELAPLVRQIGAQLPGTFTSAKQSSLFEQGLSSGRTIDVEISGPDLNKLVAIGGRIFGQVRSMPRLGATPEQPTPARPIPSLDLSSPEVHVVPKLMQAAEMQISSDQLGYAVDALVDGAYAGDYYLDNKKIDLTLIGQQRFAERTQDVDALPIATPSGKLVSLDAIANVVLSSGPEQIYHRERVRAITIEVSPPEQIALEDAMDAIQMDVVAPLRASGQLDGGYQIRLGGTADKLRDTWAALRANLFLALLITYLLMAALFESWLYPLVIIFSVPLGAVGGILGLQALNLFVFQSLDVLTMLGFVILIGTVVNNPILIVHQSINHMRDDGLNPRDAILQSVRTRIRPIFMTTITTVLGLLPLVVFPGAGSELYRGLGSVVLGGLLVSTVVTLVLVPTAFSLTMQAKRFVLERFGLRGDDPFDDGESDGSSIDEPLIASPVAEFKKATG